MEEGRNRIDNEVAFFLWTLVGPMQKKKNRLDGHDTPFSEKTINETLLKISDFFLKNHSFPAWSYVVALKSLIFKR